MASPRDTNLHVSEVWKVVNRATIEASSLRRQKTHPPQQLVDLFEEALEFFGGQEALSRAILEQTEAD